MKKYKKIILFSIAMLMTYGKIFAAGIYQNQNQSAEFIRTMNRSASTDVDAVYFNPAGTAFLEDGLYVAFHNQYINDLRTVKDESPAIKRLVGNGSEQSYEGNAWTALYPDLYIVYKKDYWAVFTHLCIIGAGASASFDNGLPSFDKIALGYVSSQVNLVDLIEYKRDIDMDALSFMLGGTVGGAYTINDQFSVAFGLRYIQAIEKYNISLKWKSVKSAGIDYMNVYSDGYTNLKIDSEAAGNAFSLIGGIHLKPIERMDIGFRYEYHTILEVNTTKDNNDINPGIIGMLEEDGAEENLEKFNKGGITKKTLPMMFTLGISYLLLPQLRVETGFTYFFNTLADWGQDADGKNINEKYINGYDVGFTIEYLFSPKLKVSSGFSYSISGRTDESTSDQEIGPDAISIGLGGTYTLFDDLQITLSGMYVIFFDEKYNEHLTDKENAVTINGSQTLSERTFDVALGITYRVI